MAGDSRTAIAALNRRFLLDHALAAALQIERIPNADVVESLSEQPAVILAPVLTHMAADIAANLLLALPQPLAARILTELSPTEAMRVLNILEEAQRLQLLANVDPSIVEEIERLLQYPPDSAGQLMDTRIRHFRDSASVEATIDRLRQARAKTTRSLFIIDSNNRLSGRVGLQELAVALPTTLLKDLAQPVVAAATPTTPRAELVQLLERHKLADLPVVDINGRLLGFIRQSDLIQAVQEDASVDIQTMVGASRDERALSSPMFAVRKRLPWLQINLLTAFLAAAVVGLFENTISMFTALAVLLPVVAGQSGNAGAQALAVTMRGLALREISLRHWLQVMLKEVQTGFVNGIAVALTCGLGVFVWSGSVGLVAVISLSMVLAMIAAGFAGAIVPIVLTRLGQDPAQSSSIILTTVTDVAGFFSFLGIATLLMNYM
jgi:magnesium transporter